MNAALEKRQKSSRSVLSLASREDQSFDDSVEEKAYDGSINCAGDFVSWWLEQ